MTGRILIVDAVPTNRIVLRVKLSAAFYEVTQAASGAAALAAVRSAMPDLVLSAAALPDMTGPALCADLRRRDPRAAPPVVILHDGDDPAERLASLAAGADEVLSRPFEDKVMLARLRALLRERNAEAELELREDTRRAFGLAEAGSDFTGPGVVHLIAQSGLAATRALAAGLQDRIADRVVQVDPGKALRTLPAPDVVVVAEALGCGGEGLSLLPQLRANRATRHSGLIYIARPLEPREAASALDMGANDILTDGPDLDELAVRLKRQIRRKRTNDRLRANMQDGLRAAVLDPLTGLFNRRYALPHLSRLSERAIAKRRPYAVLMADIDRFKWVNDVHGHAGGDAVLQVLAQRLRGTLRAADLIARWGGEEFLIAMPDADRCAALATAERLCAIMAAQPVRLPGGASVGLTLSIGVATPLRSGEDQPMDLIERADDALYAAKNAGRNTVVLADTVRALPDLRKRPLPPDGLPPAHDIPLPGGLARGGKG